MIAYITNKPPQGYTVVGDYFGFISKSNSEHRDDELFGPITISNGELGNPDHPWYDVQSRLVTLEEALAITDEWRKEGFPHSREVSFIHLKALDEWIEGVFYSLPKTMDFEI